MKKGQDQHLNLNMQMIEESSNFGFDIFPSLNQFSQSCQLLNQIKKNQKETKVSLSNDIQGFQKLTFKLVSSDSFEAEDFRQYTLNQEGQLLQNIGHLDAEIENLSQKRQEEEKDFKENAQINIKKNESFQSRLILQNHIFKIKSKKECQKKNTNFIKFILVHFFDQFRQRCPEIELQSTQISQQFSRIQSKISSWKKNLTNRQILQKIFILSQGQKHYRKIVFDFLRDYDFLNEKIFNCNYVRKQNKKQYLLSSKVYALRCKCKKLTDRVQTR